MPKAARQFLEIFAYFLVAGIFLAVRLPCLPAWWADFNADYALVGVMGKHTLEGHFPIFYYGQTYMGGAEWATAALLAKLRGEAEISLELLRLNTLGWWALAGAAWAFFLRRTSAILALTVVSLFALGTYTLVRLAMIQDMAAQYLFFGALLALMLQNFRSLLGRRGFAFGLLLGFAWWINQTIVFLVVPALWVWHAEPRRWLALPAAKAFLHRERKLDWLYGLAVFLILFGIGAGLAGGVTIPLGKGHLKVPNGITLARDVFLVLMLTQALVRFAPPSAAGRRKEAIASGRAAAPFVLGFLAGYAPVWLGGLLGLYEKRPGIGLAILPLREMADQLKLLLVHLDDLLFSSLAQAVAGSGATFLVALTMVLLVAMARARWSIPLVRVAAWSMLLNILYVFFSFRARGAPVRYLYFCFFDFWLIVSLFFLEAKARHWKYIGVSVSLLAFLAQGRADAARLRGYYASTAWKKENVAATLAELERRSAKLCWGDMWSSYLLVYMSNEKFILTPHESAPANYMRVSAYDRQVKEANPACFVYFDGAGRMQVTDTNPWVK